MDSGRKHRSDNSQVAGQQFDYRFDDLGNRDTTGGRASAVSDYTANRRNQYSTRTVPAYVDVLGLANPTTNVTVNGNIATRKGEYFHYALNVPNATAQYPTVTVTSLYGAQQSTAGEVFVPATPETFGCDADGNLVSDGRWAYSWDGENRLVEMKRDTDTPAGARLKLVFEYDHQGRRIRKQRYTWNSNSWLLTSDSCFLYDGWNGVAELDANASNARLRTYVWGTDLSGTVEGAGGVGGLLWVNNAQTTYDGQSLPTGVHFAAYDGNGNVVALVQAADGAYIARYEYGPFGEPVRVSGPLAAAQPLRFSSKWTDAESGLVYYGYRYYNPTTGRWLSRDPIGELGFHTLAGNRNRRVRDGNLYCFVGNNPLTKFDLLGLTEKDVQTILNTFLSTLKTMCGDGRCCPDIGWLQNVQACSPWSKREGCTAQAVDLYGAMYPLTQGGLDDKWYADAVQDTIIPCAFYHNYVTMTPLTPQPEGADGYIVDKITVDTWKGCYTITRKKMIFIEPNPQQSFWLLKDETKCFKCKDLKGGTAK